MRAVDPSNLLDWRRGEAAGRRAGRAHGLHRPAVLAIALGMWIVELVVSRVWIAAFGSGPLEAVWRWSGGG